jgi:hypothetical protein
MLGSAMHIYFCITTVFSTHQRAEAEMKWTLDCPTRSAYIVECHSMINNSPGASQGMEGSMEIFFPNDNRQCFDATELVIRSEELITCRLRSRDSGHDGDWVWDIVWLVFHHVLGTQSLCTCTKSIEHRRQCPRTIAVSVVSLQRPSS